MKITKSGLVNLIYDKADNFEGAVYKSTIKNIVDEVFKTIVEECKKGNLVEIRSFGKFFYKPYERKNVINPKTKEIIGDVKGERFVFKASTRIKHK